MEERMETKGQGGKRRRVVVWVVVLVVALTCFACVASFTLPVAA